ncbi:LysR family transcriptional regulator [Vibrio sp.]|uniref:LysR family transcriptional regulator n=1 Tax=Vibrio sp. TaxID=678 RepID=UPI003D0B5B92
MNIESKWLEDFLSLAETRSFSRSAKHRFVTQPAFSRRIRALEQALDCQLFDRHSTPIQLTQAGAIFQISAKNIVRQLNECADHIQHVEQQAKVIDFSVSHALSLCFFPEFIQSQQPYLRGVQSRQLVADVDDSIHSLKNGSSDFLIAFDDGSMNSPKFQKLELTTTALLPVCAPDANGQPSYDLDSRSKANIPYLAYPDQIYLGRCVHHLLNQTSHPLALHKQFESSLADSLRMMAMQGLGVAWVPALSVKTELASGSLIECGGERWQLPLTISLFRCDRPLSPAAEQLWQELCRQFPQTEEQELPL